MAYKGNIIKAKDFLGLKSLVNTECKKRKYNGHKKVDIFC